MIEKSTIQKVLTVFFENPSRDFHLRELSRLLKLSMPTIISTTDKLAKEMIIIKEKGKVVTKVMANRESINFAKCKRLYNLELVYNSNLTDFLSESYNSPKAVILFGSFSRGEDIEKSDIDIAVITNRKLNLNLPKYESILKRAINVHEVNLGKISEEFKANLLNGIVLEGSW